MSVLYLIRHGQANSTGEDYDLLTDRGKEQAFALGKCMANNGDLPDKIVSGSLRRHKETAEFFLKGVHSVCSELKTAPDFHTIDPNWNEFPAELWKKYAEYLSSTRTDFARTLTQFAKVRPQGGMRSTALFFKLTEEILSVWREGSFTPQGIETYENFQSRVNLACDTYFQPSSAERIFIFTSGTPISLTLRKMLNQDEDAFTWMPWIWNSSVSMFRWVRGRYIPVSLNFLPHIADKSLRTLY
ncbi:histidine phosphatase family protein [Leptospira sarikeiensis]|uniref:Histidine phosphatase family protein n=1 Tax=Leptospira sarikeiensis TaxID=2484943 RepID=A0A4R9K121_9LEPT|nr:histidine phosphatase family protein [Leptospira sarikeiensis]TGL57658.1 histidine phosphatase family protein [Leptospira sarikeiensis]